ncbi:MAG TPA: hypothetical protein VN754_10470, partial [Candidatus Binataceae bacterium]|nr:hypothetical protein [Candidatus Binataceae bacterium]
MKTVATFVNMRTRTFLLLSCFFAWASDPIVSAQARSVEDGRYLFYVGGCASCHAAPASAKCDDPNYKDPL